MPNLFLKSSLGIGTSRRTFAKSNDTPDLLNVGFFQNKHYLVVG